MLYEIITLGGFPFQGMSNHQVLATVRAGGHIRIPDGCKVQLRAIMMSCFNNDPSKRPTASTIVEFISNHPRMLTPCMDVPKPNLNDQVNLIDDEQENDFNMLEFDEQLPDRGRSHTPIGKVAFLRTSTSASALQNNTSLQSDEEEGCQYIDMRMSKRPNNGIFLRDFNPDLTSTLPNRIYNPVEPLLPLQKLESEISKSNSSLMRYMPMCGKKSNRNPHLNECTSGI